MLEAISNLFDSSRFMPHGHCYLWRPDVLWLNVGSDFFIALSYFSIPIALVVFVRKRRDLAFNWIFRMFAAFIFACGATHLFEIWTVWNPDYLAQGMVKLYTAVISGATAFALWPLMPKALALPSPALLRVANDKLHSEIADKTRAQLELMEAKRDLELRVEQRTSELRRANRIKDEFLSTLSHELRTPLNVILGYADFLRLEPAHTAEFQVAIESIQRNARIQAELINDLLDVSRIITGKLRLENVLVDPAAIIDFAVDAVKLSAEAKHIKIETKIDEITGFILGDPTRLQQVLWNLLANAIKFSPRRSTVTISTRRLDSRLEIRVMDHGQGIDHDFLPHVFERFRQEDSTSTRAYGGLGLGLSIVRHIVELHGGTVFAESDGKDKGSTFKVILPVMTAPAKHMTADNAEAAVIPASLRSGHFFDRSKVLSGIKILVVDDENDTRTLVRSILMRAGAEVRVSESAVQAREMLENWLPTMIVSDIGMIGEDGISFMKKLRAASGPSAKTPAVALTAYARQEDRDAALHAGYQAHASKPIGAAQLIEIIQDVLQRAGDS